MVSFISAQDMERYLAHVASIDLPAQQKAELIGIVHAIMSHFVDQAFGVQTDQISIESRQKSRFQADSGHDNVRNIPQIGFASTPSPGASEDSSLGRQDAP